MFGATGFQVDYGNFPRPSGANVKDGVWHTLAMTIKGTGANRVLSVYVDGVFRNATTNNIGNKNVDNNYPFLIGVNGWGSKTDFIIRDIVILSKALSDAELEKQMPKEFDMTGEYGNDVVGYWPANESEGKILRDHSPAQNHFKLNDKMEFVNFIDVAGNITPTIKVEEFKVVPNSVDIPVSIFNWFGISVKKSWNLMGKDFILN